MILNIKTTSKIFKKLLEKILEKNIKIVRKERGIEKSTENYLNISLYI